MQTRLLGAMDIPGMCRDEREARRLGIHKAGGMEIHLSAWFPVLDLVDGDNSLEKRREPGAR